LRHSVCCVIALAIHRASRCCSIFFCALCTLVANVAFWSACQYGLMVLSVDQLAFSVSRWLIDWLIDCVLVCVTGTVVSTESTYKYHMQVRDNSNSASSLAQLGTQTHSAPLKQLLKPTAKKSQSTLAAVDTTSASEVDSSRQCQQDERSAGDTELQCTSDTRWLTALLSYAEDMCAQRNRNRLLKCLLQENDSWLSNLFCSEFNFRWWSCDRNKRSICCFSLFILVVQLKVDLISCVCLQLSTGLVFIVLSVVCFKYFFLYYNNLIFSVIIFCSFLFCTFSIV